MPWWRSARPGCRGAAGARPGPGAAPRGARAAGHLRGSSPSAERCRARRAGGHRAPVYPAPRCAPLPGLWGTRGAARQLPLERLGLCERLEPRPSAPGGNSRPSLRCPWGSSSRGGGQRGVLGCSGACAVPPARPPRGRRAPLVLRDRRLRARAGCGAGVRPGI